MNPITLPVEIAQLATFKAKDESRPVLVAVCIDTKRGYIAAADGFRAARLPLPRQDMTEAVPAQINIPGDAIIALVKQLKRGERTFSLSIDDDGKTARLLGLGKNGGVASVTTLIDGTFPDMEKVFPHDEPADVFFVDPKLLADSLMAYHRAGVGSVRLTRRPKKGSALQIDGVTNAGILSALVMPMLGNHNELGDELPPYPHPVTEPTINQEAAD